MQGSRGRTRRPVFASDGLRRPANCDEHCSFINPDIVISSRILVFSSAPSSLNTETSVCEVSLQKRFADFIRPVCAVSLHSGQHEMSACPLNRRRRGFQSSPQRVRFLVRAYHKSSFAAGVSIIRFSVLQNPTSRESTVCVLLVHSGELPDFAPEE